MPSRSDSVSGVLLIDKPVGPTSFDVVRVVKRALRVKSAGHTGTLDPNASGLLPICIGDATRIAAFLTEESKEYEGIVRFGVETDTLDSAGTVTATRDAGGLSRAGVEAEVTRLVGPQKQIVPMYSAHKVGGKRLYEIARSGEEVDRPEQDIVVEAAVLAGWASPDATVRVRCSKGTYIRSLAALLGTRLGSGAHLFALRRLSTGPFRIDSAMPLDSFVALMEKEPESGRARILSAERALDFLPALALDARRAISVAFGNAVTAADARALGLPSLRPASRVRLIDPEGFIVAVGELTDSGDIRLARVLRARQGPGLHRG
jgi:tRNA pseudouridine55 synthase